MVYNSLNKVYYYKLINYQELNKQRKKINNCINLEIFYIV